MNKVEKVEKATRTKRAKKAVASSWSLIEIGWLDDVAPISTRLRLAGLSSWSRRAHLLHAIFVYARTSLARDLPSTRGLM